MKKILLTDKPGMPTKTMIVSLCGFLMLLTGAVQAQDNWAQKFPSPKPSFRFGHAMAYIGSDQVLLFGGYDSSDDDETWIYDLSATTWTLKSPSSKPSARHFHAMAYLGGDQVLLFGGVQDPSNDNDETWVYDLSDNTWTQKLPTTKPPKKQQHAMAYIGGDQALLFGGGGTGVGGDDMTWVYDLSDNTWAQKSPASKPSIRTFHAMTYLGGDQVLLFGGEGSGNVFDDTWVYDLSDNTWTLKSLALKPSARLEHAMAYLGGDQALLFGGISFPLFGVLNDETWVYDLRANTWTLKSPSSKPAAQRNHAMADFGGDQVLLFGGNGFSDATWVYTHTSQSNTFMVTNTNNSGAGSLHQAILDANAQANVDASTPDTIKFNIPGAGPHTIAPLSALPAIADPVIIDGLTQLGASSTSWPPTLKIELNGASISGAANGLNITVGNCTVRGLVINRFQGNGIGLTTGGNNHIESNFIGTDITGTVDLGNFLNGVSISGTANNTIGGTATGAGNLISGNDNGSGVSISGSGTSGNIVQGNFIGTNASGTAALPNPSGIFIGFGASGNIIGGTAAGARNVISGNNNSGGIFISGSGTSGNLVQGNLIGTNANGTAALSNAGGVTISTGASNNTIGGIGAAARNIISGNTGNGMVINGTGTSGNLVQGNFIGTDVTGTVDLGNSNDGIQMPASNNTVGGTAPGAGNVISGNNGQAGIDINLAGPGGNLVQGNYIGTDVTGTVDLGNSRFGIFIVSSNNAIGGTAPGARNIISGNDQHGIYMINTSATGNQVQGNVIGADINGTNALGNGGAGVYIDFGCANNTIGGSAGGASNIIAFNGADGVTVTGGTPVNNAIRGNAIFSNSDLGIDLSNNEVTTNDAGDGDSGPNNLQNFPVITAATTGGLTTTVQGTLDTPNPATVTIELFANDALDPTGFGEGKTFLGTATPDGAGNWSVVLPVPVPVNKFVTATTTDAAGNTSEFAAGMVVINAETDFLACLTGDQEVPTVTTNARGGGMFTLNAAETELTFNLRVANLSGAIVAAHFHNAAPGVNGGVVRNITFTGETASGVWKNTDAVNPLTSALVAELLAGRIYVNVHTAAHPGGEIRGQLVTGTPIDLFALLNGRQEVPPVVTPATGSGTFLLSGDGSKLDFDITVNNLSSPMLFAHFHNEAVGVNGPVVRTITSSFVGNHATGTWTENDAEPLTPALVAELLAGRIYVNVHTTAHTSGEIRGQLGKERQICTTYDFPIAGGAWYLISLPVVPTSGALTTLFPDALAAFEWDYATQNYMLVTTLVPGRAYWLLFLQASTAEICGQPFNSYTNNYTAQGWDMVGSVTQTSAVTENPSGSVLAMFGWDPLIQSYVNVSPFTAQPAQGYWILVFNVPCAVTIGGSGPAGVAKLNARTDLAAFYQKYGTLPPPPPSSVISAQLTVNRPADYGLSQNYPNPFNPETVIEYQLPENGHVSLKIYDLVGREVRSLVNEEKPMGYHRVKWDAKDNSGQKLNSGVYLYRIQVGTYAQTRKILLVK